MADVPEIKKVGMPAWSIECKNEILAMCLFVLQKQKANNNVVFPSLP